MLEVADVLRRYGDTYLQRFAQQMLPSHRRAFYDILHCRTVAMGGHVYLCDRCGHEQYAYHSCKNRSCPKCQTEEAEIWLGQRRQELLNTPYFHLVFTLPKELHEIVRRHQKTMYGVLMRAAAHSLMKLAADPRYVGGRIGILAVLHTCTRTLCYHPHVHCLVPAGGVTNDGCWLPAREDYLVPVKALSLVFRGVFLEMARKALPQQKFPDAIWAKRWWIDCRPTVQGTERILQYLARYVYRVAFSNSRLICIDDGQVTFRYQKCGERQWRSMTLPASEFIRRFLQHVLPRGTHKVRYYGIWHPSHRQLLRRIQLVTGAGQIPAASHDDVTTDTDGPTDGSFQKPRTCPHCGKGILVLVETIPRQTRAPP
jgi:predicted RNA-binding Zn-ribbon protein involved in translation (DUF1610 family)